MRTPDGKVQTPHSFAWLRHKYLRAFLLAEQEDLEDAQDRRDAWQRSGNCECDACGCLYSSHPQDPVDAFLTILCDRSRVKL